MGAQNQGFRRWLAGGLYQISSVFDAGYYLFYFILQRFNVFTSKVLTEDSILLSCWRQDRVVIRAARRSTVCRPKGRIIISQLFKDPEYWSDPRDRTRKLPPCSQVLYLLS